MKSKIWRHDICTIWYDPYDMIHIICTIWYAIWYAPYDMIHMIWSILTTTYNQFNAVSSLECSFFDIPINSLQFKPLVLLACQKSKCIWRAMSIFVYFINLGSSRDPFWDRNGRCFLAERIHPNAKCRTIARLNLVGFSRLRIWYDIPIFDPCYMISMKNTSFVDKKFFWKTIKNS